MATMIAIAAALVLSLAIAPEPAASEPADGPTLRSGTGDDPEALRIRTVADEAAALVDRGEHDAALARIAEAEAERPSLAFAFMRGAVEEDRGRCATAIEHYRRFLEMGVPAEDADAARAGLRRCGVEPTPAEPPPEPEPAPRPTADVATPPTDVATPPTDALPPTKPWYADPAGGVLAAVGLASIVVGGTSWGLAVREASEARSEDLLSQFDERARRAQRMQPAGIALVAIGGAFVIAAAVRYGVLARRGRSSSRDRRLGAAALGVYTRF